MSVIVSVAGTVQTIDFPPGDAATLANAIAIAIGGQSAALGALVTVGGVFSLPSADTAAVVNTSAAVTLVGAGSVIGAAGGITFVDTVAGTVALAIAGGNNVVSLTGGGSYAVALGAGDQSVVAAGSGSISAGAGRNTIQAAIGGGDSASIVSTGTDLVSFGAGTGFVTVAGTGGTILGGGGAMRVADNGTGTRITAGSGASSIFSSDAAETVRGVAGADVDYINTTAAATAVLLAGAGAETLNGAGASAATSMVGAAGGDVLIGGSGNDTMVAVGATTMAGGAGTNVFVIDAAAGGATAAAVITDYNFNDTLVFQGFSTGEVSAAINTATTANNATTVTLPDGTSVVLVGVTGAFNWQAVPCFAAGTRLRAASGEVPVERLRVGDRLVAHFAGMAEVAWIGHRTVDCRRHPRPAEVWPVRVAAHAFGPGRPARDLFLSPDHAVFVEGALIPVRYLMNGGSIAQVPRATVTYFHVELARHDVVLAEGLECESYLDTGNRAAFANAGPRVDLVADFSRAAWDGLGCAPLELGGPRVAAARAGLAAGARASRRAGAGRRRG